MPATIMRLSLRGTRFGEVAYPPGGTLGPRWQWNVQFVAVYEGSAEVRVMGRPTLRIEANEIGLLLPDHEEQFTFAPHRPTHHGWCDLTAAKLTAPQARWLARLPSCLALTPLMRRILTAGLHAPRAARPAARQAIESLGRSLLSAYVDASEQQRDEASERAPAVVRAQRFMEAHFADRLDVERVAEAAHVSGSHLVRLFRQQVGLTPMQWLWRLRVQQGVDRLRHTGLRVGEVAEQCGFQSPFHFSRRVRQQTGCSPRQLRQRQWQPPAGSG